jgi:hypothetical protein
VESGESSLGRGVAPIAAATLDRRAQEGAAVAMKEWQSRRPVPKSEDGPAWQDGTARNALAPAGQGSTAATSIKKRMVLPGEGGQLRSFSIESTTTSRIPSFCKEKRKTMDKDRPT